MAKIFIELFKNNYVSRPGASLAEKEQNEVKISGLQQADFYRVRGKIKKIETKIFNTAIPAYLYMIGEGAKGFVFVDSVFVFSVTKVNWATSFTNTCIRRGAELTL